MIASRPQPAGGGDPIVAPYAVRRLEFTFELGTGEFGETGTNQILISGLRAIVHIDLANTPHPSAAYVRIFGLTLEHMNQLSRAGLSYKARTDRVRITAGDSITGMQAVFFGEIIDAYPDMRVQPQVSFYIYAIPTYVAQLKPVAPTSFPGSVKSIDAITALAKKAGLTVEDRGVHGVLASPYFQGSAWDQVVAAVRAADCFSAVDSVDNKLIVWPKDGSASAPSNEVEVSPETGMIGYPTFQALNVIVKRLYDNKTIKMSDVVRVKSQLAAANGRFTVIRIDYDLSSEMPDGPWEMTMRCYPKDPIGGSPSTNLPAAG
jgi:hypothetical protein